MAINEKVITGNGVVRPTYVEVNLARLTQNYRAIQQAVAPAAVMPILKANAYGHGLVEVARHMGSLGAPYLGVAFLEEGILLREYGVMTPILVLGGVLGNQVPMFLEYDLTLTASSIEKLVQTNDAARAMGKTARVHLKIDTGMERIGVHYYSAESLLETALRCDYCQVEGIFSHFASSDAADLSFAREQLARFNQVLSFYEQRGLPAPIRHMANSGGILQLPQSHLDMVRAGIVLYGVYPSDETRRSIEVRPALSWKSRVVYFKVVQPGHPVSYGSTWQSDHMVRVVTVPAGYGDGYFRSLSNHSKVIIRGEKYPIVGRICMDQMMVNIEWGTAYNGDEVILIGEANPGEANLAETNLDETNSGKADVGRSGGRPAAISCGDLAKWAGTIPYEILTNINTRVPRLYIDDDG
jgi:alanine racemase